MTHEAAEETPTTEAKERKAIQIAAVSCDGGERLFVLDSTGCIWTLDPVNQAGVGVDGGWTKMEVPWKQTQWIQRTEKDEKCRNRVVKKARAMSRCNSTQFNGEALSLLGGLRDALMELAEDE